MGLPWIQMAKEFPKSPEAIALGEALKVGRHAAVGLAAEFWCWAADHAPDGRIEGPLATLIIDDAMGWRGKRSFVGGMLMAGLLEKDERGIRIVGWDRYARALEKSEVDARRKRERRGNGAGTARAETADGAGKGADISASGAGKSQSQIESQKLLPSEVVRPTPPKSHQPLVYEAPTTPPDTWAWRDFFRWFESRRIASGLLGEKWPNEDAAASWWNACGLTPGVTTKALQEGAYAYSDDPHWEKATPPWPFAGFMSQWAKYTKPEVKRGNAA